MREIVTPDGKLVITEAAVAGIARAAASACEGVAEAAPRRLQDELADLLRSPRHGQGRARQPAARGVEVELDAERCVIAVDLEVAYGHPIAAVCRSVVVAVARRVRAEAGVTPERVDVRVVGVRGPGGAAGS